MVWVVVGGQDGFQEKANCPPPSPPNLTHYLTLRIAAGKKCVCDHACKTSANKSSADCVKEKVTTTMPPSHDDAVTSSKKLANENSLAETQGRTPRLNTIKDEAPLANSEEAIAPECLDRSASSKKPNMAGEQKDLATVSRSETGQTPHTQHQPTTAVSRYPVGPVMRFSLRPPLFPQAAVRFLCLSLIE